jgi:hypothetical protein
MLRTLVTGRGGVLGGGGNPQRIMVSSRPSAVWRTTGAIMSGNIAGKGGRLPMRSQRAVNNWRIASWPLVTG